MKRDQERELTRRALIKWSVAAGAALGVSRSKVFDILSGTAGRDVAYAAAATPTKRSVHIRAGDGGLAWFQLMWPHNDIAARASSQNDLAWHKPGQQTIAQADKPLTVGPDTPWRNLPREKQITALMCGDNEQHTREPESIARSVNGNSMFAIASVLQATNPTVVPVLALGKLKLGAAPGAPAEAAVEQANDIIELFNSAASRAGGLLQSTKHQDLYRAHYATLAGLNRAATRTTTSVPYATGRAASKFLGTNLAAQLTPTPAELQAYGIATAANPKVAELARTLLISAKAFQLGLTSSVILPAMQDDPHDAFAGRVQLTTTAQQTLTGLRVALDAFLADLTTRVDSVTNQPLVDDVVITIEGDTPKTPLQFSAWPDATPQNSNWMYILGGGKLKSGWFGGIKANGGCDGFDPTTGNIAPYNGMRQAEAAVAAMAYAITKGDSRRVGDFTKANINGLIVP